MSYTMSSNEVLAVKDLFVQYNTDNGVVYAVNGVSFSLNKGETLGLVGETGAGKTTTALSILRLVADPPGEIKSGEIWFNGENLLEKKVSELRKIRGSQISMIFQDPMSSLNPVIVVGEQIAEVIRLHNKCSRAEAAMKASDMLALVGIQPDRYNNYPHQFSGGMKQRVVIAIALACNPDLLIADEPTTALDVTIQAQVLELMKKLNEELQSAMLLITHDLGVVAEVCDKVAIMYAGEIVEYGSLDDIFNKTAHEYTKGLFKSIPSLVKDVERLTPIQGLMPDPTDLPIGCKFSTRCEFATDECKANSPGVVEINPGHFVKCCKYHQSEVRSNV